MTGDVSITFDIQYDLDPSYDFVYLDYSVSPGTWQNLAAYTASGSQAVLQTVTAANHPGSIRFRFRVVSDGGFSDEDGLWPTNGAAIVDNLTITDDSGVVDSQDFETEPVGFLLTLDFDWFASTAGQYGNYAALLDGDTVLQEDPSITNSTYLWGFFSGSTANYGCGGHPEQAAVPFSKMVESELTGIQNEARSPEIPYLGVAPGSPVRLDFDVYTDMPLDNLVFYEFRVRSKVGGVWKRWRGNSLVYYNPEKEWLAHSTAITSLIEAGATSIQIAIGARDMCPVWCGIHGPGTCHSHGPMIDNVRVIVSHDAFAVTNANDSGAGSLRDAITQLNASLYGGVIRFDIPGTGPFVIQLATPLPSIVKRVVLDGTSQPGWDRHPPHQRAGCLLPPGDSVPGRISVADPWSADYGYRIGSFDNGHLPHLRRQCRARLYHFRVRVRHPDYRFRQSDRRHRGRRRQHDFQPLYERNLCERLRRAPQPYPGQLGVRSGARKISPSIWPWMESRPMTSVMSTRAPTRFRITRSSPPRSPARTSRPSRASCRPPRIRCFAWSFSRATPAIPAGYGDGQTFIGYSYLMTDGAGDAIFDEYLALPIPTGSMITATATDPSGNTSEFSPCLGSVNTLPGSNVVAQPVDETTGNTTVTITFDQVDGAGNTSLVTGPSGPALPGTFDIGDGIYYDLSTTATFTGTFEVCIIYNEGALTVPEGNLRLLHWDDPVWVDITTSLDVVGNTICGETDHFSPFVLAAQTPTGVGDSPLPPTFALRQNVPNPFNPTTTISYDVPEGGADVTIRIYDVSGREVATLVDGRRPAGAHQVTWDGRNSSGNAVSTGVYFYRMVAGSFVEARRMVLLK